MKRGRRWPPFSASGAPEFRPTGISSEPLSENEVRALVAKTGSRPRDLVRMREPEAAELDLDDD